MLVSLINWVTSAGRAPTSSIVSSAGCSAAASAGAGANPMVFWMDAKALNHTSARTKPQAPGSTKRGAPTHSLASSRSFMSRAITLVAASSRYSAFASSCLELWNAFLISRDSSMIASYSDWRAVRRAGIEVWLDGRGGSVLGSEAGQREAWMKHLTPVS